MSDSFQGLPHPEIWSRTAPASMGSLLMEGCPTPSPTFRIRERKVLAISQAPGSNNAESKKGWCSEMLTLCYTHSTDKDIEAQRG